MTRYMESCSHCGFTTESVGEGERFRLVRYDDHHMMKQYMCRRCGADLDMLTEYCPVDLGNAREGSYEISSDGDTGVSCPWCGARVYIRPYDLSAEYFRCEECGKRPGVYPFQWTAFVQVYKEME